MTFSFRPTSKHYVRYKCHQQYNISKYMPTLGMVVNYCFCLLSNNSSNISLSFLKTHIYKLATKKTFWNMVYNKKFMLPSSIKALKAHGWLH